MCFQISIHALLAESDLLPLILAAANLNFYPRSPCGERLGYTVNFHAETGISIHALLAESDHSRQSRKPCHRYFYPRSPCGERHLIPNNGTLRNTHNFYPRSPCGERRQVQGLKVAALSISIHALLAESDSDITIRNRNISISIHALLAESDCVRFRCWELSNISIHALLAESDS